MYISTMVAMIVMIISRYFKCGELSDLGALTLSVNHISFCYAFDFIYTYMKINSLKVFPYIF